MLPLEVREERRARFMAVAEAISAAKTARPHWLPRCRCWWIRRQAWEKRRCWRSYADAPEIDGVVKLLPPEKISKTLKVGEFTKARIVGPRP
jgi:ribosomal protein S12 methylthiotransferase